ncbi:MAG: hypothetical protein EZS28_017825 [Streblomastix strix]|uniref:Uncharacterized protein n=1 Tax=Streblomastix strix TaxID=222440 RepID=A0A5J4VW18_9EUKA|nr:MAG: hypothetical protein EZS28_017825 [Streblomastix strix]
MFLSKNIYLKEKNADYPSSAKQYGLKQDIFVHSNLGLLKPTGSRFKQLKELFRKITAQYFLKFDKIVDISFKSPHSISFRGQISLQFYTCRDSIFTLTELPSVSIIRGMQDALPIQELNFIETLLNFGRLELTLNV